MSTGSLTHSTTKVAQYGITQSNCQYEAGLYAFLADLVSKPQKAAYAWLYQMGPNKRDQWINSGDVLFVLAPEYRNWGGGLYDAQAVNRKYTQEPLVASSLNGFAVPLDHLPGGKADVLKDPDVFRATVCDMIRPIGIALVSQTADPTLAGTPKNPPIAVHFGMMPVWNTSKKHVAIGDIIIAEPPLADDVPPMTDMKHPFTPTMRKLVLTPFNGTMTKSAKLMQKVFKCFGSQEAAHSAGKPLDLGKKDFLPKALEDQTRAIVVGHIHEQWFKAFPANAPPGEVEVNTHYVNTWKQYSTGADKRYIQQLACAAPTPARAKLSEKNLARAVNALDMVLGALSQTFAMMQEWIMGRAMTAAAPGQPYDLYTTKR